ncbi:MAG: chromosomal replication initiation protein DnaA [Chloroflexi bacterium RBG_13_52_12]|nr:MAG: chromosomal replication initiation protein DnaA [Chloroflexi bacterium RBG_13_52_12]
MDSIKTRTPGEIWEIALGDLQVQVSKPNFRTWFSKTTGLSYQDNQFVIGVPNTFAAEYLEKNQLFLIVKALIGLTSPDVRIVFQVNGKSHLPAAYEELSSAMPALPPTYTRLNPDYVFDAFVEGAGNRLALAAALSVSQNPGHGYNPLFIYGGAGLGKTHLLHSIGQAAIASHINVICTSAEQFTNEFVSALRERTSEEFRNKYRSIGMLLIDDIQFIGGKEQTEESFFHTFNELHNTNRQIVITSDCPPKSMPLLEERLRSRFEWGLIVDIQPPDYETRLAILQSKARLKGVNVPREVLELIAREAQSNIRVLEGSLNRVFAYSKLLRATPTLEIASKALEDVASKEYLPNDITPSSIIEAVANCFQLPKDALTGRLRDKDTALARRLAMYLIRQETNYSLAQIGQELGKRDAASVNVACKKIAGDIASNPFLKRKVRDIQRTLNH